jgi:SAM-dependent methyltransferase
MSQPIYDRFAHIYDLQHSAFADDLPLYLTLVRQLPADQAVLELGAGSGRVMKPLKPLGRRVVGVDESEQMLKIARSHLGPDAALVQADVRTLRLDERFGLVIIALNTFLHNETLADQLATLDAARRHLLPGGRLVVDLPPNDELSWQPDDDAFQVEATLIDPVAQSRVTKSVASRILWATQQQALTYKIEEERDGRTSEQIIQFTLRHVLRHEMDLLLKLSGFAPADWYGDYQLHAYADDSPRMICIAATA